MEPDRQRRRRFIRISAAAVAGLGASAAFVRPGRAGARVRRWRGEALGADAAIALVGDDKDNMAAKRAIEACVREIRRLERIFSLYKPASALSRLNRNGRLAAPPAELVELLGVAARYSEMTRRAFDVTVQPLWQLYSQHFQAETADPAGPDEAEISGALLAVDYRAVSVDPAAIAFDRPGMAITLNGIAQGYITDRVTELLADRGFADILVDMGENRAQGVRPGGGPWRVGLRDPRRVLRPFHVVSLTNQALATSGGYGYVFDRRARFSHLLDPRSGASAHRYASVSVIAPKAVQADALSTAFALLSPAEISRVLGGVPGSRAIVLTGEGRVRILEAG